MPEAPPAAAAERPLSCRTEALVITCRVVCLCQAHDAPDCSSPSAWTHRPQSPRRGRGTPCTVIPAVRSPAPLAVAPHRLQRVAVAQGRPRAARVRRTSPIVGPPGMRAAGHSPRSAHALAAGCRCRIAALPAARSHQRPRNSPKVTCHFTSLQCLPRDTH